MGLYIFIQPLLQIQLYRNNTKKSHFSIEMKISYTLFLTVMVAISIERCRAEYLLVAVDDDVVREPNNDDKIRRQEIEKLRQNDICEIKPCCCDSCYPCDYELLAELRKIAEERKAADQQKAVEPKCSGDLVYSDCHSACEPRNFCGTDHNGGCILVCRKGCGCPRGLIRSFQNSTTCINKSECKVNEMQMPEIVPTPRECCKKAGVPAFCLGNCSPADAMARQGNRINACSKYDTIIEGCFQAAEPMRLPEPELKPIQETSDDKDGPIISHGSPTIVKPSAIPKQEQNAPASKEDPGQCIGVCGGICPPCKSEPIPEKDPGQCIGVCGGICPPCKIIPKEDPESQMQSRGQCTTPCTGNECCCGRNTCASSCC